MRSRIHFYSSGGVFCADLQNYSHHILVNSTLFALPDMQNCTGWLNVDVQLKLSAQTCFASIPLSMMATHKHLQDGPHAVTESLKAAFTNLLGQDGGLLKQHP